MTQKLIKHHTKYKEIHGVDEVVLMNRGEHKTLHERLRREGKCKISVKELARISRHARARARKNIYFNTTLAPNVQLIERMMFNLVKGNIYYDAHFSANHGKQLIYEDI